MQIFFSPASPYVRKVLVVAQELGLADRIERLPSHVMPIRVDAIVAEKNPLTKVPTLLTDDGMALYDSRVIVDYLMAQAGDRALCPVEGPERWRVLVEQALADGLLDAALLTRYENAVRPAELRWQDWTAGQLGKIDRAVDEIETRASGFGERVDLGTIAIGCALGYLDFRFADRPWRDKHPAAARWFERFSKRPAMQATAPKDAA